MLLADSLHLPLARFSRMKAGYLRIPPLRFQPEAAAGALSELITREGVGLILPTCEEIFHLARLAQQGALPSPLFAPPFALLREAHDKGAFIRRCAALGLAVPRSLVLTSRAELERLRPEAGDLVFKPVWSRFAAKVLLRPSPQALDPIRPTPQAPWLAQAYLPGEEISLWAMAHHGRLRGLAAYRARARAGQGAAIACEPAVSADITDFARRFIEGTGWHGQISFDLRRDAEGRLLPIECNPRATSGLHFFRDPKAFAAAFGAEGREVHPDVTGPQGVKAAMLAWGVKPLLRHPRQFLRDWSATGEMTAWPGDPPGPGGQIAAMAEFTLTALRHRLSLQEASTRDIEWNGED